jgi:hypothetical protein
MFFEARHGTTPDLIYARGVPNTPSPYPTSIDKKKCTLIIVEIGFCMDLGCDITFEKKDEKYIPLLAALKRYWGRVEFIAFPIGHAGTTLIRTLDHLTAAFSTVRPNVERSRASRGATSPATDYNPKSHDYNLFKALLDSLTDLAQSRLLGIIRHKKGLVDALPGGVRHHRANSDASPTHRLAAHKQGAVIYTHSYTRPGEHRHHVEMEVPG